MCMNSEKKEFDRYAPSICICMNRASDGFTSADVIPPVQLRDTSTASWIVSNAGELLIKRDNPKRVTLMAHVCRRSNRRHGTAYGMGYTTATAAVAQALCRSQPPSRRWAVWQSPGGWNNQREYLYTSRCSQKQGSHSNRSARVSPQPGCTAACR